MKIFFYISTIRGGGAAKVMTNLANLFCKTDMVVLVTNFPAQHEYYINDKIRRYNLEREEIKKNVLKKNIERIKELRKYIKKEKPDIIVSFMGENNFRAIIADFFLASKIIISVRNTPDREYSNRISRIAAKILYNFTDGCVFQTEDAKRWFSKSIQKKSRIIVNQVDEKFFCTKREVCPRGVVTIGRISEQKNHKMLIKAYADICTEIEDDLFIYGEGILQDWLEKYADEMGISDRVHFCGYTQTPEKVYASAKCFILSSDYEGLPNVLMEAMAMGVPCISTDCACGGPRTLINNGVNGYLVLVGNSKELSEKMLFLLKNPDFCAKISNEARKNAQQFRSDIIFERWREFFLYILSKEI